MRSLLPTSVLVACLFGGCGDDPARSVSASQPAETAGPAPTAAAPPAPEPAPVEPAGASEAAPAPADERAADDAPPEEDTADWFSGDGHQGLHRLAWRPEGGGKVPRNREFAMEVLLERDGEPVEGASLQITAWMPAHQHGLVRLPLVDELGGGRYRVTGMLLHMRGEWNLRFEIYRDRTLETVTFDLEL